MNSGVMTLMTLLVWLPSLVFAKFPLPTSELERKCFASYAAERVKPAPAFGGSPSSIEFSNLKSGYRVVSPFWVEMGVRGYGVVPAGAKNQAPKTGHHHILIDKPLPASVTASIPFDKHHVHFGKGETGALVTLPAGRHTLRLLFADHQHVPHFVYSEELVVEVLGNAGEIPPVMVDPQRFAETCASWYQREITKPLGFDPSPRVYFKNLRSGESLASPLRLKFGAEQVGICSSAVTGVANTGYFMLDVEDTKGKRVKRMNLDKGQTEATLDLPLGSYKATLHLIQNNAKLVSTPPTDLRINDSVAVY